MRFDKIKSFWISSNFHGAVTKVSMEKALDQVEDIHKRAS